MNSPRIPRSPDRTPLPSVSWTRLATMLWFLVILLMGEAQRTSAHAELASSDPPADGLLASAPRRLVLTFTEPVAADAGSPSLRLIDDQGREQSLEEIAVTPGRSTEVTARVPDLGPGTYTVAWGARSETDGHTLTGSYAFRVGGGRAPGVATVEGGDPRAWAVATRWLTFLGAALLIGSGVFVLLIAPGAIASVFIARLAVIGALVALAATLLEPFLQTLLPPEGAGDPSLSTSVESLPDAWWFRPLALMLGSAIALTWWSSVRRQRRLSPVLIAAGPAAGLVALLGLSLTGHGAGRESWRWLAVGSDVLHQWSVAIWAGGLVALVLWRPEKDGVTIGRIGGRALLGIGSGETSDPVSRFSRLALPLVIVGVGTGVLNAGLVLPTIERLVDSTYGRVILGKVALLLPALLLATFHRVRLRAVAAHLSAALGPTLRLEAALALLVILGGSLLALLAPPRDQEIEARGNGEVADAIDLAAPIDTNLGDAGSALHLRIEPVRPGENEVEVFLAAPGQPPAAPARIAFSLDAQVALAFTSLSHPVAPATALGTPDGVGGFGVAGLKLSLDGWWQIEIVVRQGREAEIRRVFYLLLPDPNIHGLEAVRIPRTDQTAKEMFERGLAGIAALHQLRYTQRLNDGDGNVALIEFAVTDGSDGNPPARSQSTSRVAIVSIGEREWLQRSDGEWTERAAGIIVPPSEAVETYEGATAITLGSTEEIGGETAQIVSFYVPATQVQSEAWFTWWVGTETGHVLREAMVARAHYMITEYRDFNDPISIAPPVPGATTATPGVESTPAASSTPRIESQATPAMD